MRAVSIIGIGQMPAQLAGDRLTGDLAAAALQQALADAGHPAVQAVFASSMFCQHDGAALSRLTAGLGGVDARCTSPTCGGGAALHMAVQAVAAGACNVAAVVGADAVASVAPAAAPDEAALGLTAVALDALILRRYMYEYSCARADLAPLLINARRNALANAHAALHTPIDRQQYIDAPVTADPMTALDSAPACSGAAAVVICPSDMAQRLARQPVQVGASAVARDTLALHDRADVLWLHAAHASASAAYAQAGLRPHDIDLFELHDASTIMALLSLEATGCAEQGSGVRLLRNGAIALDGESPMSTGGGLLGRGDAGAASGLYQAVEAVLQLRGAAGENQVRGARVALIQSMTGNGACAATHILRV